MAKSSSIWIDQLVSPLGLDKETIKAQILPFLDSFDDETLLRTHLQGLVGTDTALAKSFLRDFTRSRFPQQAGHASGSTTPTLSSAPISANPSGSGNNHSSAQRKRAKKTLAERAGIGQTLAPRKLEHPGLDEQDQMAKLQEVFGGMGTVYRKKQDEEDFFAGTKGKKGKRGGAKAEPSTGPRKSPQPEAAPIMDSHPAEASYSANIDEPSSSISLYKPSPPPTAEMLAIDAVVEELTSTLPTSSSTSSSTVNRKLCFCQGCRHPLAPYAPLCYSCGLILCSAIHPSPLSRLSSCPSCSASPLLSAAARSDLVAKLTAEREILYEQQLLQIQLQREQKKLNKSTTRSAREEEAALFPQLGAQPGSISAATTTAYGHTGPVMGKHGALQKARAIAGGAQRTSKVLSLDMKTHKLKQHTKITRPKVTEVAKADAEKGKVVEEVEQDPFVGLDGLELVRNDADDGLRATAAAGGGKAKAVTSGTKTIPKRSWIFAGNELTLQATPAVK
ncbi:uncharacterized protein UDID_19668 [Ustilago sp. UG-2017a]|nr:uncharacterized protein UDID_19668 [Ustilago sp. UG-2017a]